MTAGPIVFHYGETVQLWPYVGANDDGMGNTVPSWGDPVSIPGCAVAPGGTSEPRNGLSERVVESPQLFYPNNFPVHPRDRIERGAETYEVEGFPADWRQPQTGWVPGLLVVPLKRIEG